jgi:hypothetical protein
MTSQNTPQQRTLDFELVSGGDFTSAWNKAYESAHSLNGRVASMPEAIDWFAAHPEALNSPIATASLEACGSHEEHKIVIVYHGAASTENPKRNVFNQEVFDYLCEDADSHSFSGEVFKGIVTQSPLPFYVLLDYEKARMSKPCLVDKETLVSNDGAPLDLLYLARAGSRAHAKILLDNAERFYKSAEPNHRFRFGNFHALNYVDFSVPQLQTLYLNKMNGSPGIYNCNPSIRDGSDRVYTFLVLRQDNAHAYPKPENMAKALPPKNLDESFVPQPVKTESYNVQGNSRVVLKAPVHPRHSPVDATNPKNVREKQPSALDDILVRGVSAINFEGLMRRINDLNL